MTGNLTETNLGHIAAQFNAACTLQKFFAGTFPPVPEINAVTFDG
jgi:hypothetical protein